MPDDGVPSPTPVPVTAKPAPAGWASSQTRTRSRGAAWRLLGELSSARTAAILISIIGLATWLASYYERDYGMAAAHVMIYQAWWFNGLFLLITVAVVGAVAVRWPLQRRQYGFGIVHLGLLLLIAGFARSGSDRLDGMLTILPGQEGSQIDLPTDELRILDPNAKDTWRSRFQTLEFSGLPSIPRYLASPLLPIDAVGVHLLDEPLAAAHLPSGTTVRVHRVVNTGEERLGWLPAPGDAAATPATHVSLAIRPPGGSDLMPMGEAWLTDNDGILTRGPLTITLARTQEPMLVEEFLSAPAEDALDGRLVALWHGKRHELVIDRTALPQQLTLDEQTALTVVRVIPNPVGTADGKGLAQDPDAAINPVLELALRRGSGAAARMRTLYVSAYSLLPPIADLPELAYRHPQLADPAMNSTQTQGGYVHLLVGPDGRLHLRSFTRTRGAGPTATIPSGAWEGAIIGGETSTAAMELRLSVRHLPQARPGPIPVQMRADRLDRATRWLDLEVSNGGASVRQWLARGQRSAFSVPGFGEVMISYGAERYDLARRHGFRLRLDRFTVGKDPGKQGNASYESDITVLTDTGEAGRERITMNEPLTRDGVTFYQSAFFPELDEHGQPTGRDGTVLTVAEDRGRILKYLGSLVLVLGILVMYLLRGRR